jgi:hypothetical protein
MYGSHGVCSIVTQCTSARVVPENAPGAIWDILLLLKLTTKAGLLLPNKANVPADRLVMLLCLKSIDDSNGESLLKPGAIFVN